MKRVFLTVLVVFAGFAPAGAAQATSSGGISIPAKSSVTRAVVLPNGQASVPGGAPPAVQRAIIAANRIIKKPYCLGGGHGDFREDRCYDCSGTVSWALNAAGVLRRPMASGSLASWGRPGRGKWITVYANASHAYMVIAGLRLDTANTPGDGPGWSSSMYSTRGRFTARHPAGY